jgi:GntR family transcriptional regulator, transcriptional repressor for pyruvate dehydrogenase complex
LVDARLMMEPMMARLAAERRAAEIQGQAVDPDATGVTDDDTYLDATHDFHRTLVSMSGNPILNLFCLSLEDIFHQQITGLLFPKNKRRQVLATHQEIARAVSEGRSEDAERLMRQHMQDYADYVQKRHPDLMDTVLDWR